MIPSQHTYVDTNVLMRWVESLTATATSGVRHIGAVVDELIRQDGGLFATSEVGIVEFHTNICINFRRTEPNMRAYDGAWLEAAIALFMQTVAAGELLIIPAPPRLVEHAMRHVLVANRDYGRNWRGWDALHLVQATQWARDLDAQVRLLTTDPDLFDAVATFSEFGRWVDVVDPATLEP